MRLFEFTQPSFSPLLAEFWQWNNKAQLKWYMTQNNCHGASMDLERWLSDHKGINYAETIPVGRIVAGKKKFGWIKVDLPDTHADALTKEDVAAMKEQGLAPRNKEDRIKYINSSPELYEEFCWIPHSWVEARGEILDPSGFYIDSKSGQFDKFVNDHNNLKARYHYFA